MRKTLFVTALLAALLAGCSSGVKLNDVPVEDKSASTSGVGSGQNNASGVANVVTDKAGSGVGPAGVAHVVFFDYDSFVVKAEARPVIESHARFLQANKQRKAMLEGHTDERGGREYNLALGQKRAEAVQRALVLLGVPDSQIEAVSYGKEKPAAQGADEAAWAKNRRVEFKY
ncbi:MAG: peptidoglycan-associated lipoprotein Pal [Limnohabitans sp.]|jgi:peptidoglycan-associated lipoprotein|uniref:peptidoglycan-associated lipoprotein Pal n=1 Tax=Limnohabitans sp. TaxID=1907725 RepID=UPI0011D35D8E|nr:MAG: peptidoglycan-associated lipoprotein Pal [Limnohabitans sp.]